MNHNIRVETILKTIEKIKTSTLSVSQYFKENDVPFSKVQYYHYLKVQKKQGIEGLYDKRREGNHLKLTPDIKHFVKALLIHNRNMTAPEVQSHIKEEFQVMLSTRVISDFRSENNISWVRPEKDSALLSKSGAGEMMIALALHTGLIDMLATTIFECVENKRESDIFERSKSYKKDLTTLRCNGKFTSHYNNSPQVRTSRFKSIDEKVCSKRFAAMRIFKLSPESIIRYTLSLFSLPLVTSNGRVRDVNSTSGNALTYLCGYNYKAATLDRFVRELKYLQLSNALLDATARFWIDFWTARNKTETLFACYYIDGNTKALWSSKPCHKGKVTMLGRVMNCLEQVFIHDGQGHPLYFQTFNGHADLGKNGLKMMDQITKFLDDNTNVQDQFSVNRILVMDGGGNAVRILREISGYYYITILDNNQVNDRKIKFISERKRYDHGDAYLTDCEIELEDSNEKGYIFETRAVQVKWDNGRTSVLITNLPEDLFSTDNVVKSYFDRWPAQELNFKDMKSGVNIHRIVGYGKKLVKDTKVIEKIKKLQNQINTLEKELKDLISEIQMIENEIEPLILKERTYREKSIIIEGKRNFKREKDEQIFRNTEKEISRYKRKIKKIRKGREKQFKSLKKKKDELARIIDKKKRYHVDIELDQIMTCFKMSFVNICCYLLEEGFNGEKITLETLFETIFNLSGEKQCEDGKRNIFIQRNPKLEDTMDKIDIAFGIINDMRIMDRKGYTYDFKLANYRM